MDKTEPRNKVLAGYAREAELATELKRSERTLSRWRKRRVGPPYTKVGQEFWYNIERAQEWLAAGGTAAASINKSARRTMTRR